jgi:hypothetical protein
MQAFLTSTVGVVVLIAAGLTALGIIWRQAIRPVVRGTHRIISALEVVEGQTRQLTHNGGSHLRDDVTEIRRTVEAQAVIAAEVKTALESEQAAVRTELEAHRNDTVAQFNKVWQTIATRDIHKAASALEAAADRASKPTEGPS